MTPSSVYRRGPFAVLATGLLILVTLIVANALSHEYGWVTVFAFGVVWVPSWFDLEDSLLAVAVSTLIVAAISNPFRGDMQVVVDRRSNRSRYDAEPVVNEFAGSLADRIDLDGIIDNWLEVVTMTMQPVAVGMWMRP